MYIGRLFTLECQIFHNIVSFFPLIYDLKLLAEDGGEKLDIHTEPNGSP